MAADVKQPRGRGRPPINEARVIDAARGLVHAVGAQRLTTQAIADKAGVAKASIYRRWPTKAVLLAEVLLSELREAAPLDEAADPYQAIVAHVRSFTRGLRSRLGPALRGTIAECLADDAANIALRDLYLGLRRDAAIRIIRRGMECGSFAAGTPAEDRHDALYGALFYRFLFRVGDLREAASVALVEDILVRGGQGNAPAAATRE